MSPLPPRRLVSYSADLVLFGATCSVFGILLVVWGTGLSDGRVFGGGVWVASGLVWTAVCLPGLLRSVSDAAEPEGHTSHSLRRLGVWPSVIIGLRAGVVALLGTLICARSRAGVGSTVLFGVAAASWLTAVHIRRQRRSSDHVLAIPVAFQGGGKGEAVWLLREPASS